MTMKVTPPDANVINAEDVIEHILGEGGLIEQNKDVLFEPIAFNEITLEAICRCGRWLLAFVPTYEYLLTLRNPRNYYSFPTKQSVVFNNTLYEYYQEENLLITRTKNYDKIVLDYGLRPDYLRKNYLTESIEFFSDSDKLIKSFQMQNNKDFCVLLYFRMENLWWAVNVIWAFRDLIKEKHPITPLYYNHKKDIFGTHVTDLTYLSSTALKDYEVASFKDKFACNLLPITRIIRETQKCLYYHGYNDNKSLIYPDNDYYGDYD